ncbi:hypothetical protein V6N12_016577 [Hibiscus sabdariffa]|uniref:Uncharacterized protein n=1 Tax=Hibiscus sabdariffa TaxID=183260 RepID=A0ABR2CFQ0_9ROSI
MKEFEELVFLKNNHMKADPNAPPRRGHGRPPKPKAPLPPGMVLSSGRPRGRPPNGPSSLVGNHVEGRGRWLDPKGE